MKAHFFDIDAIVSSDAKVWIVDRKSPKFPVMKISEHEFNLIRSGIYKGQGNQIKFAGKDYWIPEEMMGDLKIRCKRLKSDVSNLGFSMREYMDQDIIESLEFKIAADILAPLKNSQDDIYFICSKNAKHNYEKMISKIEEKLEDVGVSVKKYYFISETFYERDDDAISHKKTRLLLQHLVGKRTDDDRFSDENIAQYDEIFYYDEDSGSFENSSSINDLLKLAIGNTSESIREEIKRLILEKKPVLSSVLVTPNMANRLVFKKTKLELHNLIRTFEAFCWKR